MDRRENPGLKCRELVLGSVSGCGQTYHVVEGRKVRIVFEAQDEKIVEEICDTGVVAAPSPIE